MSAGFVEQTIEALRSAMNRALLADRAASGPGLMQQLDPRAKVAGVAVLILASTLTPKLSVVAVVLAIATLLGALSNLTPWLLARRVWLTTLPFIALLAAPALVLTPGAKLYGPITAPGLRTAAFLTLRAEAAATLTLVLIFTTPWMHVLKALRLFRVPVVLVAMLGMTCRYIQLLLQAAHEMFESRKSRTVGRWTGAEQRRIAILSCGALLTRTFRLSDDVFEAMQARGFRGEIHILDDFRMAAADWTALAGSAAMALALLWAGR